MTREEIISRIHRIRTQTTDNAEIDQLLDELDEALPNAHISDLIFQDRRSLTSEQIADEAIHRAAENRARKSKL
jgi:hypothetical protein